MEKSDFKSIMESLFDGLETFITTKTVVGEEKQYGDTTIVPLVNISFGVGAGSFQKTEKRKRLRRTWWKNYSECGPCYKRR